MSLGLRGPGNATVRRYLFRQRPLLDGRVIVIVSENLEDEPRFQVDWGVGTQQICDIDVDGAEKRGRR
jgi:hypothetical protein